MFSRFFIDRPIFATVIAILMVIAGVVALEFLPIAQFPDITPPTVQVQATYPGASAETIAKTVATGAVIFGALCNNKIKDIVFSYDKVLNFDGETSVYVQYTCARANSVLQKGGVPTDFEIPALTAEEIELVKELANFPETVRSAAEKYEPSYIARFAVDVAQKFNKFYFDCKILAAEDETTKNFRLALTAATLQALKNAFRLLGIGIPDKM